MGFTDGTVHEDNRLQTTTSLTDGTVHEDNRLQTTTSLTDGTVHEDNRLQTTTSLTARATYVWCNNKAHLHNHCCCGKAVSITHYESEFECVCVCVCVCVALLSSMQNTCTILYCHLWPVWLYHILPHYLTNEPNIKFHENMSNGTWVVPSRLTDTETQWS